MPDRYDVSASIKAGEHNRRSHWRVVEIQIKGREARFPSSLKYFLSNSKNKSDLLKFPELAWCKQIPERLADNQVLYLGSNDGKVIRITCTGSEIVPIFQSDHEEADSHIFVHCEHFSKCSHEAKRIIIFSPDTDVAVLCCHHFAALNIEELWFLSVGRQKRLIPIHPTVANLGPTLCHLLPALHSLSGCNSTSSLFSIGKIKSISSIEKQHC